MAKRKKNSRRIRSLFKKDIAKIVSRLMPFILAAVIIGIAVYIGVSFVLTSSYFTIKSIKIIGEKTDSRVGSIAAELGLKKGVNIFAVDLKQFESTITYKHPELKGLKVKRVMPDTLEVSYNIRRPFCQIDSGRFYLVSDDAVILPNPSMVAKADLPVITGIDIPDRYPFTGKSFGSNPLKRAITLFKEIEASTFSDTYRISRIDIYDIRNPSIFMEDETEIKIGEHSFKEKERLLREVLNDLESKKRKAKVIDLRFKDVIVIPR